MPGRLDLPVVAHEGPVAVLVVDVVAEQVLSGNDAARRLAPGLHLPAAVEDWSRAAGLEAAPGGLDGRDGTSLLRVAAGGPEPGQQTTALLHRVAAHAGEALWATGAPLHGAPPPLQTRSLLVLVPVDLPDAYGTRQGPAATTARSCPAAWP